MLEAISPINFHKLLCLEMIGLFGHISLVFCKIPCSCTGTLSIDGLSSAGSMVLCGDVNNPDSVYKFQYFPKFGSHVFLAL